MSIDMTKVFDVEAYKNTLAEDVNDFEQLLAEAKSEINFYDWCLRDLETYVGMFYAGVVGVFLFRIKPSSQMIDEWIWVVVGDLPPLYLTCEECPNAACALDAYIGAMQDWVEAAESGKSIDNLAPVNVPATPENAAKLKSRLAMLDDRILSRYEGDLKA